MFLLLALASSAPFRCTPLQQNFDPGNDYEDFLGKGRPTILRATITNCPYTALSQKYWDYVASLFPHVNFLQIDCMKNPAFCINVDVPMADKATVPFHAPYPADSNIMIKSGFIKNKVASTTDSRFFIDYARRVFGVYPLLPPVHTLDNYTINNFYQMKKFKVLVLYNSQCTEASNYLGKWLDMFGNQWEENLELGALDCSKYNTECQRWSKNVPASIVFGRDNTFVELDAHMGDTISYLNETLTWAIDKVRLDDPKPTPEPLPYQSIVVVQTPLPEPKASTVLKLDRLESRDGNTIIKNFKDVNNQPSNAFFSGSDYDACAPGTQTKEDKDKTLNLINFIRDLVGLNKITIDETLTAACQHDATIMSVNDVISHDLDQNTSLKCYVKGLTGTAAKYSNIAIHVPSLWSSIFGFMFDAADYNYQVGHRRLILDPRYQSIGLGYHGNERIGAAVLQILRPEGFFPFKYDDFLPFVAWPCPGPFPIPLLSSRWSVSADVFKKANELTIDDVKITVQRDDGLILKVASMIIDRTAGTEDCLIFEIYSADLSLCQAGRSVKVNIHVPKFDQLITYTVKFVNSEALKPTDETLDGLNRFAFINETDKLCSDKLDSMEQKVCEHHGYNAYDPDDYDKCGYGANIFSNINDYTGQGFPYKEFFIYPQRTTYDIDIITDNVDLGNFDLTKLPVGKVFKFHLNPFKGKVHIIHYQNVTVDDPSLTDFIIDFKILKPGKFAAGLVQTLGKAKSVKINLAGVKEYAGNYVTAFRVYTGLPTDTEIIGETKFESQQYDIMYDTYYDTDGIYARATCINNSVEYYLEGGQDWYEHGINYVGKKMKDLHHLKTPRRVIQIHIGFNNQDRLYGRNLPEARRDYMFSVLGKISTSIEQSPELYSKMRKLMFKDHGNNGVTSVRFMSNSSDTFGRLLEFEQMFYMGGVGSTEFIKMPWPNYYDFYIRDFRYFYQYWDDRNSTRIRANQAIEIVDDAFVYEIKGSSQVTFKTIEKRIMASIIGEADKLPKKISLQDKFGRTYALRDMTKLDLTIADAKTKVYITEANTTINAPDGYHVSKYEVQYTDYAYFGHPTKTIYVDNVYIRRNAHVTFQNVVISNLTVEDCDATIIGGKVLNASVLGSTLRIRNVEFEANNFKLHLQRRGTSPQVIVESRKSPLLPVSVSYYDHMLQLITFAVFRNLTQNECNVLSSLVQDYFRTNKCVAELDIKGKPTTNYKLLLEGIYQTPTPLPDPQYDEEKIPETKVPEVENITMKYCVFSSNYNLCKNSQYAFQYSNLSSIFSFYDSGPVVEVAEYIPLLSNFAATGPITFQGKGRFSGTIEINPLCTKFVSHVSLKDVKLTFIDDGISMGYVESDSSPTLIRINHRTRPTKDTQEINNVLFKGTYVNNVKLDRTANVVDDVGKFPYSFNWKKNGTSTELFYVRKVIPEGRFCVGFNDSKYGDFMNDKNCINITMNEIAKNTGETDKVTIYLKFSQEIPTDIYPSEGGGRDYHIITDDALIFNYDKNVPGKVRTLTIENSTALTFKSASGPIDIMAVMLKNVVPVGNEKVVVTNLFATNEVKAKFSKESDEGSNILVNPEDSTVTTSKSGTVVVPPTTKELTVKSTASNVNLKPVINQEGQTSLKLSGSEATEFNVSFSDVKIVVPQESNATVVVNDASTLETGVSNTTITRISLNNVSDTTISATNANDVVNVNELRISGNTSVTGNLGKVNVKTANLVNGIESHVTNLEFSSHLSFDEGSKLSMDKCSTGSNLEISMNGKQDRLPLLVVTNKVNKFAPKSLNIELAKSNSKLLSEEPDTEPLVSGLTKDECQSLKLVTKVNGMELYPKCSNSITSYSLTLATEPEQQVQESKKSGLKSSAIIGIAVACVAVAIIIIVAIIVVKKKSNKNFSSSSEDSNEMKSRLSEDPKVEI